MGQGRHRRPSRGLSEKQQRFVRLVAQGVSNAAACRRVRINRRCYGTTSPSAPTYAISQPNNFRQSPTRSTLDPAKASAGPGRLTCRMATGRVEPITTITVCRDLRRWPDGEENTSSSLRMGAQTAIWPASAQLLGPDGRRHTAPQTFDSATAADRWLVQVETRILRREWFDPERASVQLWVTRNLHRATVGTAAEHAGAV